MIDIIFGFFLGIIFLLVILARTGLLPLSTGKYDTVDLKFTDCRGTQKAEISVRIADTFSKRYVGLSRTSSLPQNEGLLFSYKNDSTKSIVMRNMDFGLDIIYVSNNGKINAIESLESPSSTLRYYLMYESATQNGKYVIEANKNWCDKNELQEGDCVPSIGSLNSITS